MHKNEKFLQSLKYMNTEMKQDTKTGKVWRYTNKKKSYNTFEDARKNNRLTNCVSGVQMGMRMAGLPDASCHWYGAKGKIVYTTAKGKETVSKYFEIIKVSDTVNTLYKAGKLCDGDILIYENMNHTNCYYGGNKSFDSGHAYCKGNGELAEFKKWIGALAHKTAKVAYILRMKDRAHYRVQCGAFTDIGKYEEQVSKVEKAGFKTSKVVEDGMVKIQVGYFSGKTNAENFAAKVAKKKIPVSVEVVK